MWGEFLRRRGQGKERRLASAWCVLIMATLAGVM
jgi:hypothetical protein